MLAYRVIGETAIVSSDPVAPDGEAPQVPSSFLKLARERGWQVVLWGASARHLDAYRQLGLRAVCAGEEAFVDPSAFTLEGRRVRKLRQSVHRVERRGWQISACEGRELAASLESENRCGRGELASRQGAAYIAAGENRAIVVAPQGARNANSDREYLNWGPQENWPAAISEDLPRCIDKRFRTIASRRGRARVGLSAGGFGAFNIALGHLETFAAVESWSGYFAAMDPTGLRTLDLGSEEANQDARVPRDDRLGTDLEVRPTFIGFYVGQQDSRFLTANILLDRGFSAHHIAHRFEIQQGGHSGSLWRKWAPLWLGLALEHLSRPRHVR